MQISTAQSLVQALHDSGLFTAAELAALGEELAPLGEDTRAALRFLVEHDRVPVYQLRKVVHGKAAELFIGPYVVLDKLGEGGMGKVFRARDSRSGRVVALKVVRSHLLANPVIRGRYEREVQAALAVPLVREDAVVGAVTFYAETPDAFGPDAVSSGEAYAAAAAVAVDRAHQVSRAQLIADQLAAAIDEQRTVRRALGLLIAQDGIGTEQAMTVLRGLATERSTDLEGAAQIVWAARVDQGLALTTPAWR